ncbi:MAG: alkaline phosphatase family protein [Methanocella sp.]
MPRPVYFFIIAILALSILAIHPVHLSFDPALQTYSPGSDGIPLERLLWRQGIYPVTGAFAGGEYINWADAAYRSLWYIPVLVTPEGHLSIFGRPSDIRDITVLTMSRPERSILDVAPTAGEALGLKSDFDGICVGHSNASQVVVIYIDALGWQRYEWAMPVMGNLTAIEPTAACDVYPSISAVNAAALITGVMPERSGVDRWERRTMAVDNIIDIALRNNISAAWVDGPRPPVSLERGIVSVNDTDGDGVFDEEIMDRAMAEYKQGTRLLYVHLYDTDRALHETGPYSQRSLEALARADALVGSMASDLKPGTLLIVTSDHGGHDIEGGRGDHGTLLPQDMIIPFVARVC